MLQQTFRDFELILVDDGSPDRCGEICDALAREDSRIHVIHQTNGGASAARNTGLHYSCGEYILFLDGDDFYPQKEFLSCIREKYDTADMVCFNYARYTDHLLPLLIDYPTESYSDPECLLRELVRRNAFTSSSCLKAVRRSLLIDNGIEFEEGASCEDIEWNARLLCVVKKVVLEPSCIYAYRVRQNSSSHTISSQYIHQLLRVIGKMIAAEPERSELFLTLYRGYVAFQYCTVLINARICRPKLSREELRQVKKLAWLLQYDSNRIVKLIHTVYRVLGFDLTSWLLVVYFKLFCK